MRGGLVQVVLTACGEERPLIRLRHPPRPGEARPAFRRSRGMPRKQIVFTPAGGEKEQRGRRESTARQARKTSVGVSLRVPSSSITT